MYWLRFAMLAVGVFFLTYAVLSVALAGIWQWLRTGLRIENADTLFIMRVLPLLGAIVMVALVAIPSFWSLEPSATNEGIAWPALILFTAGALWILFRFGYIVRSCREASRFFALASPMGRSLGVACEIPAYELRGAGPNLFVAGVWRPRLFVSNEAAEILDAQEMQAAVRHELAHARGRDNFKQVVGRFCAFPALASLDHQWLQAAEIAADDRAVSDEMGAAELASALIKVGKASARMAVPDFGMSLVPENDAPVSARVQRLLDWKASRPRGSSRAAQLSLLLLPVGTIAINLVWMMGQMHRFTEIIFQ